MSHFSKYRFLVISIIFCFFFVNQSEMQGQCPISTNCQDGKLRINFNSPPTFIFGTKFTFCFGESDYRNGTFSPIPEQVIGFPGAPPPPPKNYLDFAVFCNDSEDYTLIIKPPNGTAICTFIEGEYCFNCPPVSCGQKTEDCMDKVKDCEDDLTVFIERVVEGRACEQWEGSCDENGPIFRSGSVSIGSTNIGPKGLNVKLGIISEQIKIEECNVASWCDYVFEESYILQPLEEVEKFIKENKHLPGIPSADEVVVNGGFELGDITFRFQEKIEEVFLYLIDLKTEVNELEVELDRLLRENEELKKNIKK